MLLKTNHIGIQLLPKFGIQPISSVQITQITARDSHKMISQRNHGNLKFTQ